MDHEDAFQLLTPKQAGFALLAALALALIMAGLQ